MWSHTLKKRLRQTRRKIANACIATQFRLSAAHGLFPYNYNADTQCLTTTKWLTYYRPLVNVLIILAIVYTNSINVIAIEVDFIAGKPLNIVLAYIHGTFSMSALFVVISRNWFGGQEFLRLHNALLKMHNQQQRWQKQWSKQTNRQIEAFFHNYLIAKSVMTLLQSASNITGKLGINPNPSLSYVFYVILMFVAKNAMLLTVTNFNIALLKICQQLQQVNWNFEEVLVAWLNTEGAQEVQNAGCEMKFSAAENAQAVQECSDVCAASIADLCHQYVQICHLAKRVYKLYEWQVLLFLIVMLYGNVMSIFYYLVYLGGKVMPKDLFSPTLFPQICLINILDLYCYTVICEKAMTLAKATSSMLKKFCQLQAVPVENERNFETLGIFMASQTTHFHLCGLFEWNFRTGASFMTATILYLVVLVQFDYENL